MQQAGPDRDAAVEQQEGLLLGGAEILATSAARWTTCVPPCTRRSSAASTSGSTRCARAQARVSAGVWQQQFVKQRSAVSQPQGLSMQGNGRERSLAESRLAEVATRPSDATPPIGNGRPEATST